MLELKNVSKFYYNKGVIAIGFSKVNLKLDMGEFVAITGESGSGKSTLLNVISGLDSYEEGEMYIDGKETSHYTQKEFEDFRRKYVSNIFQNFNLVNSYTVYQNVELVLLLNGFQKRKIKKKVFDIIQKVGLIEFKNTKVSKLSGGQKQKVAIARALAKETPIIIADEPTGNLDSESASGIIKLLSEIAKDKLVIIVTHNYEQVEEYVQRKIKMHDGRILEDKMVKKADHEDINTIKNKEVIYKNISLWNKLRLGTRNTFNIFTKFILLFIVFLFITTAIMTEYATFKKQEHLADKAKYNYFFRDTSENRIILKKKDLSSFTTKDYEKINNLTNIEYVVENDLLLDTDATITNNNGIYLYGTIKQKELFKGNLDIGRMPETSNEIIIEGDRQDYYIGIIHEELQKTDLYLMDNYTGSIDYGQKLKIVGIKYRENQSFYYSPSTIYVDTSIIESMKFQINRRYSQIKLLFMNKYYDSMMGNFNVVPNDKVPAGEAYVSSDLNYYSTTGSVIKQPLQIQVDNIYYEELLNIKITKTYTKNNIKSLLGITEFEEHNGSVFVNTQEYNNLFNKPPYQSSIFIKDLEQIDQTVEQLKDLGYESLILKNTLQEEGMQQIMKILRTVVTIILVITLFFVSYFVINIILRSRNTYFSTLRMLGANKKVSKQLLIIELLLNANLAFGVFLSIVLLNKNNVINIGIIQTVADYLKFGDYAILYIVLNGMSYLISLKYAKKLFKKSTMKTLQEEV